MKRVAVIAVAVSIGLVGYGAAAWSAAPPSPTEKKLLKDVKALQAKVKTLQADVKKLTTRTGDAEEVAGASIVLGLCSAAITADALQGTWQVADQLSAATQAGKTYFGPQTPVNDTFGGTSMCGAVGVARSQAVPPTIAPFTTLLTP
jgi:hypothetical protein